MFIFAVPVMPWVAGAFGNPSLPSHNPLLHFYAYSDEMSFLERAHNFLGLIYYNYVRNYRYNPAMEAVYKEYFPSAPSVRDIERNASLVLSNSHASLNYPRPLLPDIVETGGMHCRAAKPLPKVYFFYIYSIRH
jgi:glucuronosyltransferase